jgi:hypothetical protein
MTHRTAACEIPATHPERRAFVGVYPPLPEKQITCWRVRRFEIPRELAGQYFGEEQLIESQLIQLDTLDQVEETLVSWRLDSATLEATWKSDYPL